jgi:Zn-dependent protease with chaperone function
VEAPSFRGQGEEVESEPEVQSHLDPFALPPETDGRFRMLMIAALIMTWSLASHIIPIEDFWGQALRNMPVAAEISKQARDDFLEGNLKLPTIERSELIKYEALEGFGKNVHLYSRRLSRVSLSLVLVGSLLLLATFVYFRLPSRILSRHSIRSLTAEEAPEAFAQLGELAAKAGMKACPELYIRSGALDGLAFQLADRIVLALTGPLEMLRTSWSNYHRAVALHELGHIVNRDIRIRNWSLALWIALGFVVPLGGVLLIGLERPNARALGVFGWQTAGTLLLSLLLWAGIVRAREHYADLRVACWGEARSLERRLMLPEVARAGTSLLIRFFSSAARMHPSNAERLLVASNAESLFLTSPLLASLTGALLGLMAGNSAEFLADVILVGSVAAAAIAVFTGSLMVVALFLVFQVVFPFAVMIVVGRWITDALGIQMLRSALWGLENNGKAQWGYWSLAGLAAAFAAGVELGLLLTPAALAGWQSGAWMLLWLGAFTLLIWFWLIQSRGLGRLILGACSEKRSFARATKFARWLIALQLTVFLLPAMVGRVTVVSASSASHPAMAEGFAILSGELTHLSTSTFLFLSAAFGLNALVGLLSFSVVFVWLACRRVRCEHCREPLAGWRLLGERCAGCGCRLLGWLYA